MDLEAFRVQNYKRIEDTGWITCRDLTVLVGKNEAGKSAVLRGLSKMKPSDEEEYDGLREFPRHRYTREFSTRDWPVASVRLRVDGHDDHAQLTAIAPDLAGVTTAEVTRFYTGGYTVGFDPEPESVRFADTESALEAVAEAQDRLASALAPDGHGAGLRALKADVAASLSEAASLLPHNDVVLADQSDELLRAVSSHVNEAWQVEVLEVVAEPLRALADRNERAAQLAAACQWVVDAMPQFIYFDRYDVLDSAIHIPTFLQQAIATPHAPRVRTARSLLRHVGLDAGELHDLGQHGSSPVEDDAKRRHIDERAILTSSASQAMTRKFTEWWQQRQHSIRYQLDGDYLRVWVSDDLNPSEIELDQRSAGMQYFFSFFLVFLVEAVGAHANSVLLLDEPGTSLHGTAQAKIIELLQVIAKDNQVIYTTHSPFMIDVDHLERVRPVYEEPISGFTRVSEGAWPADRDALFPLQAALGYQLAQSLVLAPRQVLLESVPDYWLLSALDHAVRVAGRTGLNPAVTLVPGGPAVRMIPLASMLAGHHVDLAVVLNGSQPGRHDTDPLAQAWPGGLSRVIFTGDFAPDGNAAGGLEDLFTSEYYLAAVKQVYGKIDLRPSAADQQIPAIAGRLTAMFARKGHPPFERWKVARALAGRVDADPRSVPPAAISAAAQLFHRLNELIAP
ncbi:MAG: AAA family ATPase [Actinomycetota bacterium]